MISAACVTFGNVNNVGVVKINITHTYGVYINNIFSSGVTKLYMIEYKHHEAWSGQDTFG